MVKAKTTKKVTKKKETKKETKKLKSSPVLAKTAKTKEVKKVKKIKKEIKVKKEVKKETKKETKKKLVKEKEALSEKKELKEEKENLEEKSSRYYEAQGRRKTSTARVRLWTKGKKEFIINQKTLVEYFPTIQLQKTALASLEVMNCLEKFRVSVIVKGGGINGQAEAVRHGITRALVLFNPDFRKRLKKAGFLRRDDRRRERKKFGLKRARRAPQWSKR